MELLGALIIVAVVALCWPLFSGPWVESIDGSHPDAYTSGDLRSRGWDEWDAHEAAMTARAERLGYTR